MTYRYTPCAATWEGKSPAEHFLGRKMRIPLNLMKLETSIEEEEGGNRMAKQFNRYHNAKPRKFEVTDLVWTTVYSRGKVNWSVGEVIRHMLRSQGRRRDPEKTR